VGLWLWGALKRDEIANTKHAIGVIWSTWASRSASRGLWRDKGPRTSVSTFQPWALDTADLQEAKALLEELKETGC
jgi:hypothetical protein